MGKIFIPMYSKPYYCYKQRPHRPCAPAHGPSLLDVLLNGVLGQLQVNSHTTARAVKPMKPWLYTINVKGFEPDDIAVKVEDGVVHVTARQIHESDSGHDFIERYRKVVLPQGVDSDQLACLFAEGGKLILKAPFIPLQHETSCKKEQDLEKETVGVRNGLFERTGTDPSPKPEVVSVTIEHKDLIEPPREHVDKDLIKQAGEIVDKESVEDTNSRLENTKATLPKPGVINVPIVYEGLNEPTSENMDKTLSGQACENVANEDVGDGKRQFSRHMTDPTPEPDIINVTTVHETLDLPKNTNIGNSPCDEEKSSGSADKHKDEVNTVEGYENHPRDVKFVISPPESPTESVGFVIVRENDVTSDNIVSVDEDPKQDGQEENGENVLDIEHDTVNEDSLPQLDSNLLPIMDSIGETDIEGEKYYEISINLSDFTSENTTIRWKEDTVQIEAEREIENDTPDTVYRRVHREFTVPDQFDMNLAKASMDKAGTLRVILPMKQNYRPEFE